MRLNRIFSIEFELVEKLRKEENMSQTVNIALKEYFEKNKYKGLTTKELKLEKEKILIRRKAEAEIKELENDR